ncbi:MAG: glutamyl-tRNA synthetase [Frankiales bacterium]|jgi:glutamyl-tRNA synthetase|nr:glutamyl-tRNA synthetase [Frankiales bacterium]
MIRTALFNWAYARHTGGTFVFRIEDTDAARDSEESYHLLLDVLRWLGLDWDEGPDIGGRHAPYRQSQRMDLYADVARRLHEAGRAYPCYCTNDEIDARNKAAGRPPGYDNHCRSLSPEQLASYEAEGRQPVLRLRMPDTELTWDDLVRGEVTFQPEHVADFAILRANGRPLYTLTNPVDDALMEITHVLRGEDLLSSTPRQIALYGALAAIGVGNGTTPRFGHLPYVMGEGNKKLSKRDPEANAMLYRERGFLPEGLVNYLALLGWSYGDDIEVFSLAEMVSRFDVADVNASPARFDLRKCEAINAAWVRRLDPEDLAKRILIQLSESGVLGPEPTDAERALVHAATPLVQERMVVLQEAVGMLGFLFTDTVAIEEGAAAKQLGPDQAPTVSAAFDALHGIEDWTAAGIEGALREALVDRLGLKPKNAFGPVRVAVTGRTVSPPLFESLELLGRDRTLARLAAARDR